MKTFVKAALLALTPLAAISMASVPAVAQSKTGVGVVSLDRAVGQSNAFRVAMEQMQVTYKASIDSYNARQTALDTELKQKSTALETALKAAAGKPTPALQTQYEALQKRGQEAQQELNTLGRPIALARAYAQEQIVAKLSDALKAAMNKTKVDLVLKEDATESFQPYVDITAAVTTELNALVPSVGIVPPAGWQPGQAQQPAAAGSAPKPATDGR